MCGICGVYGEADHEAVTRMLAALRPRGPDAEGTFRGEGVLLGSRRLRVLDLETGDQPIGSEDGRVQVVFNGQIYNHRELRSRLEGGGHRFATRTDTEVLAHLYEDLGVDLLPALDGMFAFAIWDARRRRLLLARDRMGEKPLYYAHGPRGSVYFASELKALLAARVVPRRVCLAAVDQYLSFRSVPAPLTMVEGARSLEPAQAMIVDADGPRVFSYWSPLRALRDPLPGGRGAIVEELRHRMAAAVRSRAEADVPRAVLLSGGLDSSLVARLLRDATGQLTTVTIGFDGEGGRIFDEREKARRVAQLLGSDHHEEVVDGATVRARLPRILQGMDQPTGDAIPHAILYEAARRQATVALCGTGADELFAGYRWFQIIASMTRWDRRVRWAGARGRRLLAALASSRPTVQATLHAYGSFARKYAFTGTLFKEDEKRRLLSDGAIDSIDGEASPRPLRRIEELSSLVADMDAVTATTFLQLSTDLPSVLLRDADALSMSHSLELRTPFLHPTIVELACRIPGAFKLGPDGGKALLREAAAGLLPAEIVDAPKQGLIAPMASWMRGELRDLVRDALSPASVAARGLFRAKTVEELYTRFDRDERSSYFQVWTLAVLELWQRAVLDDRPESPLGAPAPRVAEASPA